MEVFIWFKSFPQIRFQNADLHGKSQSHDFDFLLQKKVKVIYSGFCVKVDWRKI